MFGLVDQDGSALSLSETDLAKGDEVMPKWNTYEDILADLNETARINRLNRQAQNPTPKQKAAELEQKLVERKKPDEAVYQDATNANNAALNRAEETYESRRAKQRAKEFAEYSAEGSAWHSLARYRQSLDYAQERLRELDGEDPLTGNYDPIRRFEREMGKMTQQLATKLTNNEIIAADLYAFIHRGGPDCLDKHLTLDCDLSEAEKRKAWANAYVERDDIAKATPKPMVWHNGRRYSADAMASASFFVSAPQPTAEPSPKDNAEEKVEEPVGSVGKFVEEIKASTRTLEVVKPFDVLSAEQLQTYLDAMNVRHAVIGNIGGKCRVLEWVPSELDEGAHLLSLQSKADLIARYAHIQVGWTNRGQPLTLGQKWFEHPQRANYRGVTFRPGMPAVINNRDTGSWLNVWRGWGILPEKGKWPLLRKHVEEVLSGGDQRWPTTISAGLLGAFKTLATYRKLLWFCEERKEEGKEFGLALFVVSTALMVYKLAMPDTSPATSTPIFGRVLICSQMKRFGLVISKAKLSLRA